MAGIVDRLLQNARAYVYDFVVKRFPGSSPAWETFDDADETTTSHTYTAPEPPPFDAAAGRASGLPYTEEVARCYTLLDLPFGAPMGQVTKRWKAYLRQCHPDLHTDDAAKHAEATELTQELNSAYSKIKSAWERYKKKTK
jgi:hypothetical protein